LTRQVLLLKDSLFAIPVDKNTKAIMIAKDLLVAL
jgi:hypothetical protein